MASPQESTISTTSSPVSLRSSVLPLCSDSPFANLDYSAILRLFDKETGIADRHQFYIRLYTLGENNNNEDERMLAAFLPHISQDLMGQDSTLFIGATRLLACWFFERRFSMMHGGAAVQIVLHAFTKHKDKQCTAILLHTLAQQELDPEVILPLFPAALSRLQECAPMLDSRAFQAPLVKCLQRFQSQLPAEMRDTINVWLPLVCHFMFDADTTPNGEDGPLRKTVVELVGRVVDSNISVDHPGLSKYVEEFLFRDGVNLMKLLVAKGQQAALAPALSNCLLMMGPSVMRIQRRPASESGTNETLINILLDIIKPWLTKGEPEVMNLMFAQTWKSLMIAFTLNPSNLKPKNVDLLTKPIKFRLGRKDTSAMVRDTVVALWLDLCRLVGSRLLEPELFECTVTSMLPVLYSLLPVPSVVSALSSFFSEILEPSPSLTQRLGLDDQTELEWFSVRFSFFCDQILQFLDNFDPQCKEHAQHVWHALVKRACWLAAKNVSEENNYQGFQAIRRVVELFAVVLSKSQEQQSQPDPTAGKPAPSRIERLTPVYMLMLDEFHNELPFDDMRLHQLQFPLTGERQQTMGICSFLMWSWICAFLGRKFKTPLLKCFRGGVISLVPDTLIPEPSPAHPPITNLFALLAQTRSPFDHPASSQARRVCDCIQLLEHVKIDQNCSTPTLPASSLVWLVYIVVVEKVCKFGVCWELCKDEQKERARDDVFVQWTDLVFYLLLFPLKSEHSKDIHCNDQNTEKTIESKVWLSWIDLFRHVLALAPPLSWISNRLIGVVASLPIASSLGGWMTLHLATELLLREGQSEGAWLDVSGKTEGFDIQALSSRLLCLVGPNCCNPMWCGLLKDFIQSLCSLRLQHRSSVVSWFVGLSEGLANALETIVPGEPDRNRDTIWEAIVSLHCNLINLLQQHYPGPFNARLLQQSSPRTENSGSVGKLLAIALNHPNERIRVTTKQFFQMCFLPNSHVQLQLPVSAASLIKAVEDNEKGTGGQALIPPSTADSPNVSDKKTATTPSFLRQDKPVLAAFKRHTPEHVQAVQMPKPQPPKRPRNQISEVASQTEYVPVSVPIPKISKTPDGPLTDNQLATRRRDRSVTTYYNAIDESQASEATLIQPCTPESPRDEISQVQESLAAGTLDIPSTAEASHLGCGAEPPGSLTSVVTDLGDRNRTPDNHVRAQPSHSEEQQPYDGDSQETSVIEHEDRSAPPTNLAAAFAAVVVVPPLLAENKSVDNSTSPPPLVSVSNAIQLLPSPTTTNNAHLAASVLTTPRANENKIQGSNADTPTTPPSNQPASSSLNRRDDNVRRDDKSQNGKDVRSRSESGPERDAKFWFDTEVRSLNHHEYPLNDLNFNASTKNNSMQASNSKLPQDTYHEESVQESYNLAETEQEKLIDLTPIANQKVSTQTYHLESNTLAPIGRVKFDASKNIIISPSQNSITQGPESEVESPSVALHNNFDFHGSPPQPSASFFSSAVTVFATSASAISSTTTSSAPPILTKQISESKTTATDPRFLEVTGTESGITSAESTYEEFTAEGADGARYIVDKLSYKAQLHLQAQAKGPPSSILRNSGIYCPGPQYVLVNSPAFKSPSLPRGEDSSNIIYPKLLQCKEPIARILKSFENNSFRHLFSAKNIRTIGDLSAMTIHDVSTLPMKDPVVNVRKILASYFRAEKAKLPEENLRTLGLKRQRSEEGDEVGDNELEEAKGEPQKANEKHKSPSGSDKNSAVKATTDARDFQNRRSEDTKSAPRDRLAMANEQTEAENGRARKRADNAFTKKNMLVITPDKPKERKRSPQPSALEKKESHRSGSRTESEFEASVSAENSCSSIHRASEANDVNSQIGIGKDGNQNVPKSDVNVENSNGNNATSIGSVASESQSSSIALGASSLKSSGNSTNAWSSSSSGNNDSCGNNSTSSQNVSTNNTNNTSSSSSGSSTISSSNTSSSSIASINNSSNNSSSINSNYNNGTVTEYVENGTTAESEKSFKGSCDPDVSHIRNSKSRERPRIRRESKRSRGRSRDSRSSRDRTRERSRRRSRSSSVSSYSSGNRDEDSAFAPGRRSKARQCCYQKEERSFLDTMRSLIGNLDGPRLSSLSRSQLMDLTSQMLGLQIRIVAQLSALEQITPRESSDRSLSLSLVLAHGNDLTPASLPSVCSSFPAASVSPKDKR